MVVAFTRNIKLSSPHLFLSNSSISFRSKGLISRAIVDLDVFAENKLSPYSPQTLHRLRLVLFFVRITIRVRWNINRQIGTRDNKIYEIKVGTKLSDVS